VGRGDQHVIIQVAIPKKLTDEQEQLFQDLSRTLGAEVVPQKRGFLDQLKDAFGL
jgi:molecular chaperone DnaJ